MIRTFGAWRCIRSYHDCHSPLPMNKLRLFPLANAHYITISLGWMPVIFDFFFKKLLKVYLPTPFCKFFSQKWNIPSLIASFRGHLDGTFAEKFIFLLITRGDLKNVRWFFLSKKKHRPPYPCQKSWHYIAGEAYPTQAGHSIGIIHRWTTCIIEHFCALCRMSTK